MQSKVERKSKKTKAEKVKIYKDKEEEDSTHLSNYPAEIVDGEGKTILININYLRQSPKNICELWQEYLLKICKKGKSIKIFEQLNKFIFNIYNFLFKYKIKILHTFLGKQIGCIYLADLLYLGNCFRFLLKLLNTFTSSLP